MSSSDGGYVPLEPVGSGREHVVAFARRHESGVALAIAPRLVARGVRRAGPLPPGADAWGDTDRDAAGAHAPA